MEAPSRKFNSSHGRVHRQASMPSSQASSSPQGNTPQIASSFTTPEAHATHLETIVRAYFTGINTRQLDLHPSTAYFCSNLVSIPDNRSPTQGLTAHFDGIRRLQAAHPHHNIVLQSVQANVNLRAGYGEVYAKKTVTGCPEGVVRNGLCVMEFRLREERWVCVKYTGMRGPNDPPGETGEGGGRR